MLADVPGARVGIRAALAFATHGLGIAKASLGRPEEARAAFVQARAIFAELDHHALVAFTLLDELSDAQAAMVAQGNLLHLLESSARSQDALQ